MSGWHFLLLKLSLTALPSECHPIYSPESSVENLDGYDHELPALEADGRSLAAGPDVVVVGHIDVENLTRKMRTDKNWELIPKILCKFASKWGRGWL